MKKVLISIAYLFVSASIYSQVNVGWSWYSIPSDGSFNSATCFQQGSTGNFINGGQSGTHGIFYSVDGIGNLQSVKLDSISGATLRPVTGQGVTTGEMYFIESITGTGVDSSRILKFNMNLSIAWSKNFQFESPVDVGVDPNQNIVMLSDSDKVILRKIDPNGNVLWTTTNDSAAGNSHLIVKQLKIDNAGNIYVMSMKSVAGDQEFSIKKFASTGSFIWETDFNPGIYKDEPNDLFVDDFCNLYVTGSSYVTSNGVQRAYASLKMDSSGTIAWSNVYSTYSNVGRKIRTDLFGQVYVAGSRIESNGQKFMDIIKYNAIGDTVWVYSSDSLAIVTQGLFRTMGLTVEPSGYIVVAFQRQVVPAVGSSDFTIAQIDPSGNGVETVLSTFGRHWSPYIFTNSAHQIFVGGDFIPDCGGFCQNSLFIYGLDDLSGIISLVSTSKSVRVFPNPATTALVFDFDKADPMRSVILYDALGREILNEKASEKTPHVDRGNLTGGIYFYKIVSGDKLIGAGKVVFE